MSLFFNMLSRLVRDQTHAPCIPALGVWSFLSTGPLGKSHELTLVSKLTDFAQYFTQVRCKIIKLASFYYYFKNILFIFSCAGSSLLHVGFLQLQPAGAPLGCGARASHCSGFSCCRAWALECELSSCGSGAQLLHSMWDLPGPGIKPVSPALTGRLLSTAPPGKSKIGFISMSHSSSFVDLVF